MTGEAFGARPPADDSALWVTSYLDRRRRSYVVVLAPDQDLNAVPRDQIRELTPTGALQWARVCMDAAAAASHDAAVLAQLRRLGVEDQGIADTLAHLRADRAAEHQLPATAGYALRPGVAVEGHPFLILSVDDVEVGQWTIPAARQHALAVLMAVSTADLDGAYWRSLVDRLGIGEARAGNVVADLDRHRTRDGS